MALSYRGGARLPGPLGAGTGSLGGRIPGPLRFEHVDLAKGGATRAVKILDMPEPWHSSTTMRVGISNLDLVDGTPKIDDVKQGALPNCPLAAILAALAFTPAGQKHLNGMVTEYTGATVKTKLPPAVMGRLKPQDIDEREQDTNLVSKRSFAVKLKAPDKDKQKGKEKTVEVHDSFYFKYSDRDLDDFVFMQAPKSVLWPAVIEKACAVHFDSSYNEMGNYHKHKANEFWELVIQKPPEGGIEVSDTTDLAKIKALAEKATAVPTLAASRAAPAVFPDVTPEHGFAVLGMETSGIKLYDPAKAQRQTLSLEKFRQAFQVILFGNP